MKTLIEPVTGIVTAGHMGIRIDGACIIQAPDSREKKLSGLVKVKSRLGQGDRLVSASAFVQATGCTIHRAGKVYKPKPTKKKSLKVEVIDLLK